MRKTILSIACAFCLLLTGCTTPEQDRKIQEYWDTQLETLLERVAPNMKDAIMSAIRMARLRKGMQNMEMPELTDLEEELNEEFSQEDMQIQAMLFLSPSCPWCKKLKEEGFPQKFRKQYEGKINLTVIELDSDEKMTLYKHVLKRYKISSGVPLLIIGSTPIRGYDHIKKQSFITAEEVIAREMPSFLKIATKYDDIKNTASIEDKQQMKEMIVQLQSANGVVVQSIGDLFGPVVKNQALILTLDTDKKLQEAANTSANLAEFTEKYEKISLEQGEALNKLMTDNKEKIPSSF